MSDHATSRRRAPPQKRPDSGGYILVVCEKPDAARRVAEALSSGTPETFTAWGVPAFRLEGVDGKRYVVCAAMGHLYAISDTVKDRRVYPALDLEWFPLGAISSKAAKMVSSRIRSIQGLASQASSFVNACDFDAEGETIGYNILRYACGGKDTVASRVRFSALTKEEVVRAFDDSKRGLSVGLARAGRLRHAIDFVWGVNLSRALSEPLRTGYSFRTVSIGRVQGPTLGFVVEKEIDVRTFVPTPYWTVSGRFRKGDVLFEVKYSAGVVARKYEAEEVKRACEGRVGVVSRVTKSVVNQRPPPPLNLADLQKEAFRLFGYAPSKTLQIAEKLYLGAMISYPRTESQRLPKVDYGALLSKLAAIPGYSRLVNEVHSRGVFQPIEGQKLDPAHPAIYPTGESPRRPLAAEERKVFGLILLRFLSCFGEDAVREASYVGISVGEHEFALEQTRTLVLGWMKFAMGGRAAEGASVAIPTFRQGDRVDVDAVSVEERFRAHSLRYNQATLLEKMEREEIGTKATRADIISTLLLRGYVTGQTLVPTELGFALIEVMREHCPEIISTRLTRDIESQLEKRIESSDDLDGDFFEGMLSSLLTQIRTVRQHEVEIAERMRGSVSGNLHARTVLGDCPVCKEGRLTVIRSRKSGKRFVGCTNYAKGCRASAPLPQRGVIRATSRRCRSCGWPVVYVRLGRYPWRLCVNDRCPRKVNVYSMQNLQKGKR